MRIGYVRVSTEDQNTARQDKLMLELEVDKIFVDKLSGKNKERPELKEMLKFARSGDTIVVESISRIARNTRDLLEIMEVLKNNQVDFVSKKEAIDTKTATGKFMLTVFGAVSELERSYILDRQREGIEIAKNHGKYKGRKPIEFNKRLFGELYTKWKSKKITAKSFMHELNLKPNTFYRKILNYECDGRL